MHIHADASHQLPPSFDVDVGELAGERDIYGSVLSAHPDTRGGGHLQTAGAQPIETPACPTTALSTAPGTGTRAEPTPAPGRRTARESSSPYNTTRRHSTLGYLSPLDYENRTLMTGGNSLAASRLAPTDRKIIQTTSQAQAA
jgi:hypothetical protein